MPYTGALMSAVPVADPRLAAAKKRQVLAGDVPSPTNPPPGCRFHTRCWKAQEVCRNEDPPLEAKDGGNLAACHFPLTDAEVLERVPRRATSRSKCPESKNRRHLAGASPRLAPAGEPASTPGTSRARRRNASHGAGVTALQTGNLPAETTSFVGRRRDVADVRRLLSVSRLVTLTGVGGVGKTRLALRVAAEVRRDFVDGVWLVELAGLADPDLLAHTVADVLEAREQTDRPPSAVLIEYLRHKRLLLVLDSCEHMIDACAQLSREWLRAAPRVRVLATSRQSLGIFEERIKRVEPLPVPHPATLLTPGGRVRAVVPLRSAAL